MASEASAAIDLDGMRSYLEDSPVVFALLFGSHAKGTKEAGSDVDVAVRFPEGMDAHQRFRNRNRIDAYLQDYADEFVDVSDVESLPTPVARAAVRDGIVLAGDEEMIEAFAERIEREYRETKADRDRERREFIDRLARGES